MANEKLAWNGKTLQQLKDDDIIKHAKSFGGKETEEALLYLQEIFEYHRPFTEIELKEEKKKLAKKYKRKKVNGKYINTDIKLYTEEEIDEILADKEYKHSPMKIKRLYCEKYYPSLVETSGTKNKKTFGDKIAEALAEL